MRLPDSLVEANLWTVAIGAMGSVMSLAFIKDMPWQQKLIMAVVGTVIAALFTQPIIDLVDMPNGWSDGIAFLVGLLGWSLVGSVISMIRKADLWGLVSDLIRSWLSRRGN